MSSPSSAGSRALYRSAWHAENGSVSSPLFSAFGPEPIKARMTIGEAKALITSEALYRRKVEPWRKELASLEHVFLTDAPATPPPVNRPDRWSSLYAPSTASRSRGPSPRTWRCCISPAARPDGRRAPSTCTKQSLRITSPVARARPARRRHLLVYRRSGLGDRHLLRHHGAADQRRDHHRRRGRVRRRALVSTPGRAKVTVWYTAPTAIRMMMRPAPKPSQAVRSTALASWRASASRSIRRPWSGAWRPSACPSTTIGGRPRPVAS